MKKILWLIIVQILIVSCSTDNFTIEGKISNTKNSMIYLDKLGIDGTTPFDSSAIDSKGEFKLGGDVSFPTFFLLRLNNQKFITLLVDSLEQISFSADNINFSRDYKIEGSIGSQKVKELNDRLSITNSKVDSLQSLLTLSQSDNDYKEKNVKWMNELEAIYIEQQEFSKKFIEQNPFSLASVMAIYQKFNNGNYVLQDLQTIKMAASALHAMHPKSIHAQTLYRDAEKLVKNIRSQEVQRFIDKYGKNSPEIKLPDAFGKEVALSSFLGKYVLVHFWSGSDRSSRIMNEVLRENYLKYKSKGFEIYQVSTDTSENVWKTAIEDDRLMWTNVGDMKGSINACNSFNIVQIPSNYLLDKEGVIIAKDLKGPALYKKLNEILN